MQSTSLIVYEEDTRKSSSAICNFLINYFESNVSSCKCILFEDFIPSYYDNCIIYLVISLSSIDMLFDLLKESDTVFNAYILVLPRESNFLLNTLITVDTTLLIKRATYYGMTLSCLEICENNIEDFEDFFLTYNEVEKFENNCIYSLGIKQWYSGDYTKKLDQRWNKFNKCLRISARDMQYSSEACFKNIVSMNDIYVTSLKDTPKYKLIPYIPSVAYDVLQRCAFKCYSKDLFLNHYFDKVYVLYLPRRDKTTINNLETLGIWNYKLFEGFDACESNECQKEYDRYMQFSAGTEEVKVIGKKHRRGIGSVGSWAILKAMHNMLIDAKNNGYKRILVLQDDVIFHKKFFDEFKKKINRINDEQWKLLYLGASQHEWKTMDILNGYYHPTGTTDGAFAVGIHSSVFDDLLEHISIFNMPFDSGALWKVQQKNSEHSYVLYKNIAIADLRKSDLRQGRDMVSFSELFHWELHNFELKNQ